MFYSLARDETNKGVQYDANNKRLFVGPPGPDGFRAVENSHVFLFRLGFFDYLKFNADSMVTRTDPNRWYSVDIVIDWQEQLLSLFIDSTPMTRQPFFLLRGSTVDSANALSIYGLSPGSISRFRNVKVCHDFCVVNGQTPNLYDISFASVLSSLSILSMAAFAATILQ